MAFNFKFSSSDGRAPVKARSVNLIYDSIEKVDRASYVKGRELETDEPMLIRLATVEEIGAHYLPRDLADDEREKAAQRRIEKRKELSSFIPKCEPGAVLAFDAVKPTGKVDADTYMSTWARTITMRPKSEYAIRGELSFSVVPATSADKSDGVAVNVLFSDKAKPLAEITREDLNDALEAKQEPHLPGVHSGVALFYENEGKVHAARFYAPREVTMDGDKKTFGPIQRNVEALLTQPNQPFAHRDDRGTDLTARVYAAAALAAKAGVDFDKVAFSDKNPRELMDDAKGLYAAVKDGTAPSRIVVAPIGYVAMGLDSSKGVIKDIASAKDRAQPSVADVGYVSGVIGVAQRVSAQGEPMDAVYGRAFRLDERILPDAKPNYLNKLGEQLIDRLTQDQTQNTLAAEPVDTLGSADWDHPTESF